MFKRETTGSVVCPSCGRLVGIQDERCLSCGKWNPGLWGFAPMLNRLTQNFGFMEVVIGVCSVLFIATYAYAPQPLPESFSLFGLFSLGSSKAEGLYQFGASGAFPMFIAGRWWTVLSAGWLHGGLLHILMNMMCLRQILPAVAEFYGIGRMIIIYVLSSVTGFFLTSSIGYLTNARFGAGLTIGASAALMGLSGALICYGRRTGSKMMTQMIGQWVAMMFVIGWLTSFVDNWAHFGGLIGGYAIARVLDPMREEKPGHRLAALGLLILSAASVVLSLISGPRWPA